MMGRIAWLAILGLAGCGAPTSILVEVSLASGEAPPNQLFANVFDARRPLVRARALDSSRLPGTLVVTGLPELSQPIRVVVTSDSGLLRAGAAIETRAHAQVRLSLVLGSMVADRDGDLIPDLVDNCADSTNATQDDADGDGAGDACDNANDAAVMLDGAAPDLARAQDLAALACPSGAFCEDFESGTVIRVPPWEVEENNAVVRSSTTLAHRGQRSAHIHSNYADAGITIAGNLAEIESLVAGQPDLLAIRVWAYLPPVPPSFALIGVDEMASDGMNLTIDTGMISLWNGFTQSFYNGKSASFGAWNCIEWHIYKAGETRVFHDGSEIAALHKNEPTHTVLGLSNIYFGVEMVDPDNPVNAYDVYLDDIVVDDKPIGCQ